MTDQTLVGIMKLSGDRLDFRNKEEANAYFAQLKRINTVAVSLELEHTVGEFDVCHARDPWLCAKKMAVLLQWKGEDVVVRREWKKDFITYSIEPAGDCLGDDCEKFA